MVRRAYGPAFSDDEIEDVYSNAWMGTLRALESRQAAMDDEEVRRYVFTAVAHQAGKELRRRRRRPVAPLERAAAVVDTSAAPDERADQHEQSRITRDLLSSLPPRRRAVLLLRYGWGLEPAQVCELIEGLSLRAYRKEITRGVDELTDRIRILERGAWCAEREPVLKAFAAGIADAEQARQAQHHLSHCRPCSDFVGRLCSHLHDLGSATAVPAVDLAADGHVSVPDHIGDLAERARDTVSGIFAKAGASAPEAGASLPSPVPRGAGAAGAGLLAKLAGVGAAGKAALACVGGGAVATVCVVAGLGPGLDQVRQSLPTTAVAPERRDDRVDVPVRGILPSQVGSIETLTPPPDLAEPLEELNGSTEPPPTEPVPTEPPPVPAEAQQFGEAPAPAPTAPSGGSGEGDMVVAAQQEFGP
jgi:RNA polymerase sigma factor (sigma-70 family)